MGCTPSYKRDVRTIEKHDTSIGILKVTVVEGEFYNQAKQFTSMKSPFLILQVSNQAFTTNSSDNLNQHSKYNQTFNFSINSFYKGNGRFIEVQLKDHSHLNCSRAYGIADIDPIIKKKGQSHDFKVILNQKKHAIGHINLSATFIDVDPAKLSFRFQTAAIRRRTNLIKDMNVFIRVTLGQEVLETNKKKDLKQTPASWQEQILEFIIPRNLKEGLIEAFDQQQLIGSYSINIQDILKEDEGDEILHVEELTFKKENAGTLKYSVMVGQKGVFSILKDKVRSTIAVNRSKMEVKDT